MTRYIFCILMCVLLVLGMNNTINGELQGFRYETGIPAVDTSAFTEQEDYTFTTAVEQTCEDYHSSVKDKSADYRINDGILVDFAFHSSTAPSKILKNNANAAIIRMRSSLDSRFPDNKWKNLLSDTNCIKYSTRYYLYTLDHILI